MLGLAAFRCNRGSCIRSRSGERRGWLPRLAFAVECPCGRVAGRGGGGVGLAVLVFLILFPFWLGVCRVLWSCRVVVSRLLGVTAREKAVGLAWALGLLACSCVRLLQAAEHSLSSLLRMFQMHWHLVARLVFGLRLACDLLRYHAGSTPRSQRCEEPILRTAEALAEQRMLLRALAPQIRAARAKAKAKAKVYASPPRRG